MTKTANFNHLKERLEKEVYAGITEEKRFVVYGSNKLPKNAKTGGNAMSNNKDTFSTFDEAVEAVLAKPDKYIGVGIVAGEFTKGKNVNIIDIDKMFDANGKATEVGISTLRKIFEQNIYGEKSMSGFGIHAIIVNSEANKKNKSKEKKNISKCGQVPCEMCDKQSKCALKAPQRNWCSNVEIFYENSYVALTGKEIELW